jgi:DNA ligase (NAD+)
MTREQAEGLIKSHGGKITGSVTKKTSYLLAGADPGGSKYNKAVELSIPVLDEAGLLALVGGDLADGDVPAESEDDASQLPMDL